MHIIQGINIFGISLKILKIKLKNWYVKISVEAYSLSYKQLKFILDEVRQLYHNCIALSKNFDCKLQLFIT